MFSQSSFQPITNLPPQRPSPSSLVDSFSTSSPTGSKLVTPDFSAQTSPTDEKDDFDLDDPKFNASSRSRGGSIRERLDHLARPKEERLGNTGGGLATLVKPEDIGSLLRSLSRGQEGQGGLQDVHSVSHSRSFLCAQDFTFSLFETPPHGGHCSSYALCSSSTLLPWRSASKHEL